MNESFFFARHSERSDKYATPDNPESTKYPGLTEQGVELAQEQAKKLQQVVEEAPANAIIFIGGSSEEDRTRSTANILGDSLAEMYADNPDVQVLTQADLVRMRLLGSESERPKTTNLAQTWIAEHPDKKLIISYPLFLKELSIRPLFREQKSGNPTQLSKDLYAAGGGTEEGATKVLMEDGELLGDAAPQKLAEQQLKAIQRLENFGQELVADRPLIIGITSHAWNLDALASYLANDGKADMEGFEKAGDKMIEQAEIGTVTTQDGQTTFHYRDQDFPLTAVTPEDELH